MNGVPKLWKKIYGSAVIASSWKDQLEIPFLPNEKVEDHRDHRLRRMIRYATQSVPYYRELFDREGINPDSIRHVNDLERLPILKKKSRAVRAGFTGFTDNRREKVDSIFQQRVNGKANPSSTR